MGTNNENSSRNLEQELAGKASELAMQLEERKQTLVQTTLEAIAKTVRSKKDEILKAMSDKGGKQQEVREIVMAEIVRVALGRLWCPAYSEKLGSEQRMKVYTGTHWQDIEPQQWRDFVGDCARRCCVSDSLCMSHSFMNQLTEGTAFNLAKSRKQRIPHGEEWLNLSNGTLVVKADGTIELRSHRMEDFFTYTLDYPYDPQAMCPQWHWFLDRVLPEPESQQVLREFIAYCLMKGHHLEKMLLLYGEGLNGKSVTLEVIEYLLGSMNVSYLSLSDLTNDDVKRAGIEGKKLNISHESGKDVNPNVLKQLTSGERVLIKHLYIDPRETNDYGKFIAAFNQLPKAEITFGFFRRLLIIPYEVTIPKDEIDRQLPQKLKSEISGVLNWVVGALPGLMSRNEFTVSPKCEMALEHYRLQSDSVRLFVNEQCQQSDFTTKGSELSNAYRNYCYESGLRPIGKQRFYERLESLGYQREIISNVPYFKLRIVES